MTLAQSSTQIRHDCSTTHGLELVKGPPDDPLRYPAPTLLSPLTLMVFFLLIERCNSLG